MDNITELEAWLLLYEAREDGKTIQFQPYNCSCTSWCDTEVIDSKNFVAGEYRIKPEEPQYKYPLYFESAHDGTIVKFTGFITGVTVKLGTDSLVDIGISTNSWVPHTNEIWTPVAYNKEKDLFDKQLVWAWDDDDTHRRTVRFYDAINDGVFSYCGKRRHFMFSNYEAYEGEYPEWATEAYKTLED